MNAFDAWIDSLGFSPSWWWLLIAAFLCLGELIIPGVFLIWVAIAAGFTAAITYFVPMSTPVQIILFAILCVVSTLSGKRWYAQTPSPSQDPLLNDKAARLLGKTVTVAEALKNGEGRVKVGDSVWSAAGPDLAVGKAAKVVAVEGNVLRVEAL